LVDSPAEGSPPPPDGEFEDEDELELEEEEELEEEPEELLLPPPLGAPPPEVAPEAVLVMPKASAEAGVTSAATQIAAALVRSKAAKPTDQRIPHGSSDYFGLVLRSGRRLWTDCGRPLQDAARPQFANNGFLCSP
jgi:hypothetical protein